MRIGIIGFGVVGKALNELLEKSGHDMILYDEFISGIRGPDQRRAINSCELAFVAVPTPENPDGSANIAAIESVLSWLKVPACIKSTMPPGTTQNFRESGFNRLCYSPEYLGETLWHRWGKNAAHDFLIVGGERDTCDLVIHAIQQTIGPELRCFVTDSTTAELCKHMVNSFLATKVAFVNQFFDLAQMFEVDFNELRELWLADDRIGRSHTMVTEERGFRGKCLPKDLIAIIRAADKFGGAPFLDAVDKYNDLVCRKSDSIREVSQTEAAECAS